MNPAYEFEDLEDYLADRMSAADRQAFEQALETDPELVQRVEALRAEAKLQRLLREEYLLEQFAEWDQEDEEKKTEGNRETKIVPLHRQWWVPLAVAATLVGIVALVGIRLGWFGVSGTPLDVVKTEPAVKDDSIPPSAPVVAPPSANDRVVEQTPTPPPSDPNAARYAALATSAYRPENFNQTLMGAGADGTNTYTEAVKLYSAKQYKEALRLLEKPEPDQQDEYLYLRGYTRYQLGQYAKAEQDFRALRNFEDSDRRIDAAWGEVFCLVQQLPGSRKRLDAVLQDILAKPGGHYYQRALELQQALPKQ